MKRLDATVGNSWGESFAYQLTHVRKNKSSDKLRYFGFNKEIVAWNNKHLNLNNFILTLNWILSGEYEAVSNTLQTVNMSC